MSGKSALSLPMHALGAGREAPRAPRPQVTKSAVMTDDEGKSRGFGFVNFDTHEEATAAIEGMHEQEVDGRKLYCARAQPKAERERVLRQQVEERRRQRIRDMEGRNVFVKNLADSVDDDGLRKLFQDALGEKDQSPPAITSARVMKEGQVSKGFGFVCFAEKSDAQKALKLSGKVIEGKPLFVSMAQRKEERQKALMTMRFQMGFPGGMPGMMMPYGMMPGPGMPQGRPGMPGMIPAGMPMGYPGMQGRGMGPMGGRGMQGRGMGPGVGRGRGGRGRGGIASATMPPRGRGNRGGGGVPRPGGMLQPGAMPQPVPGVAPGPQGAAPVPAAASTPAGEPDLVTKLAHAPEGERKNILGEELYPLVQKLQPELAPKITGMFLELEDSEVLLLIADEKALQEKVDEALTVLKDYGMIGAQ